MRLCTSGSASSIKLRQLRQRQHGDALFVQLLGLVRRGLAPDIALLGLAVVDAAGLLGEVGADVLEVGHDVLPNLPHDLHHHGHALLRPLGGAGRIGAGDGRGHDGLADRGAAAGRASDLAALGLLLEGRVVAEPALEAVLLLAAEREADHAPAPTPAAAPSSLSSSPGASSACSSSEPPTPRPSMKICGTVRRPSARFSISSRRPGSCQRSTSLYATPLRSSRRFARAQ